MISTTVPVSFTPNGRILISKHPEDDGDAAGHRGDSVGGGGSSTWTCPETEGSRDLLRSDLQRAFKAVSLNDSISASSKHEKADNWKIRLSSTGEEELYFRNKTVLWFKSDGKGNSSLNLSYTFSNQIKDAIWASFLDLEKGDRGKKLNYVVVDDGESLHVISDEGDHFPVSLPFQVRKMKGTEKGILLERYQSPAAIRPSSTPTTAAAEQLPILFSLSHPLKDITPVILRTPLSKTPHRAATNLNNDSKYLLIDTCPEFFICILYNKAEGTHSIWLLREAFEDEVNGSYLNQSTSLTVDSPYGNLRSLGGVQNASGIGGKRTSSLSSPSLTRTTLANTIGANSTLSPSTSNLSPSLKNSRLAGTVSPFLRSFGSPFSTPDCLNNSTVGTFVPAGNVARHRRLQSLGGVGKGIGGLGSPFSHLSNTPRTLDYTLLDDLVDPVLPEQCLEQLWTESSQLLNSPAKKIFPTTDLVGQTYLVFFNEGQQTVKLLKIDSPNTRTGQLIFGSSTSIPAKDVESVPSQKMFILIDPSSSSLILYSGVVRISVVYLPSAVVPDSTALEQQTSWNHSRRASSFVFMSPASFRRTSLLSSSRPASALGEARRHSFWDASLSPVVNTQRLTSGGFDLFDQSTQAIQLNNISSLIDGIGSRVTVTTQNGIDGTQERMFRVSLPPLATSAVVSSCIKSLKAILPRDASMTLMTRWYCYRNSNAHGSEMNDQKEVSLFKKCLLSLVGYEVEDACVRNATNVNTSLEIVKKPRLEENESGTDEDWEWFQNFSKTSSDSGLLSSEVNTDGSGVNILTPTPSAPLFPYLPSILYALHLTYEEMKLHPLLWELLPSLLDVLFLFSCDLRRIPYQDHYWRDFPDICRSISCPSRIPEEDIKTLSFPSFFLDSPPSIYSYLLNLVRKKKEKSSSPPLGVGFVSKKTSNSSASPQITPFPFIPSSCRRIRTIVLLFACLHHESVTERDFLRSIQVHSKASSHNSKKTNNSPTKQNIEFILEKIPKRHERLITAMVKLGVTQSTIQSYPFGISLILWETATFPGKRDPSPEWPVESFSLVGRSDLVALKGDDEIPSQIVDSTEESDGYPSLNREALRLVFPEDQRVSEAWSMLQSSKPVKVSVTQRPGVSDHDFQEEQERHLYTICIRTMAISVGRGMLTLRTYKPVIAETFPIPKLCLSGQAPPRNTSVELTHIDVPVNMTTWPLFHNGVAAGLRACLTASDVIDSSWIMYNRPRSSLSSGDAQNEHAGFLLALGLNGHLAKLSSMNIHEYLCRGNELTRVAILLGLAAARRGTRDDAATKILSVHVEALLPPTSTELDVPPVVQVASVLGIGLLYQGSGHGHISEVLLNEIGRPPGPEMEHYIDRESYALAAGLALGLVTLGKGNSMTSTSKSSTEMMSMADQLCNYMVGGHKAPLTPLQREKYKTPSYQIREGDYVNADVTSPGATLALGMLFFDSKNEAVANWMSAPDTQQLLETVRPDFLLLRTLAKGLIMWSDIRPTKDWVMSHLPRVVVQYAFQRSNLPFNPRIDYETMSQAYCNIVAGACFSLGLKFAGSSDRAAFKTVMGFTKMFIDLPNRPDVADQAGRSTIESCLNVLIVSLAMIMAGTGDVEVMKICRYLRSRTAQVNVVLYGSHMATHMALGLLFLGGCRFSLSTTKESIAALLCSFFPKYPIHSNDNRYHLQAFRHLYVLAVEPRLIIPRDIDSGEYVFVHLTLVFRDGTVIKRKAPMLIPELDCLQKVTLEDDRYWKMTFERGKNWDSLSRLLSSDLTSEVRGSDGILHVKKKVGCLSYQVDPKGYQSTHSALALKDAVRGWTTKGGSTSQTDLVGSFTTDPVVRNYASLILSAPTLSSNPGETSESENEEEHQQTICSFLVDCASNETMECLESLIQLDRAARLLLDGNNNPIYSPQRLGWPRCLLLWQIKVAISGAEVDGGGMCPSLKDSFVHRLKGVIDAKVRAADMRDIVKYLRGEWITVSEGETSISEAVLSQELPPFASLSPLQEKAWSFPELASNLRHFNLPVSTLVLLADALSTTGSKS